MDFPRDKADSNKLSSLTSFVTVAFSKFKDAFPSNVFFQNKRIQLPNSSSCSQNTTAIFYFLLYTIISPIQLSFFFTTYCKFQQKINIVILTESLYFIYFLANFTVLLLLLLLRLQFVLCLRFATTTRIRQQQQSSYSFILGTKNGTSVIYFFFSPVELLTTVARWDTRPKIARSLRLLLSCRHRYPTNSPSFS